MLNYGITSVLKTQISEEGIQQSFDQATGT